MINIPRPVHDDNGRPVGSISISGNIVALHKTLSREKHMVRIPVGWATDTKHLDLLSSIAIDAGLNPAAARVVIHDDHNVIWSATVDEFMTHGFWFNRGYGNQRLLPEKFWHRSDDRQPRLF
jgi:hypothetical protein